LAFVFISSAGGLCDHGFVWNALRLDFICFGGNSSATALFVMDVEHELR
jgi:hypothetical protein